MSYLLGLLSDNQRILERCSERTSVLATKLKIDSDMLLDEVSQLAHNIPEKFQQAITDAGDIADRQFAGQMLERMESRAKLCLQTMRGQLQKRRRY